MSATLQELLAQRAAIEKQIASAQREEREGALTKIRALMTEYGLTPADLAAKPGTARAAGGAPSRSTGKVAPKFRNAATGETWTGRGLQPKWLKSALEGGAKLEDFAIQA
ncbi:MAG: hypothetical protein RLY78_2185 [Pseudomonadota bacterium]|jgi:DNA-binding protein H-NS